MNYCIDASGRYLGGFSEVPEGATVVPSAPDDARQPWLGDSWGPVPVTRAEIEANRLRAYADPLIGSDRYFSEAQRETLLGNTEAAEAAKAQGLARYAEIQAENPWPGI